MIPIEMTLNDQRDYGVLRNKQWVVRGDVNHVLRLYKIIMRAQKLRKCKMSCLNLTKTEGMIIAELEMGMVGWGNKKSCYGRHPLGIGRYDKKWLWWVPLPKPVDIKKYHAAM